MTFLPPLTEPHFSSSEDLESDFATHYPCYYVNHLPFILLPDIIHLLDDFDLPSSSV